MNVFDGINFEGKISLVNANHMASGMESLYSELHTVQLRNYSAKQTDVRIIINVKNSHSKILQIKINDENNPFYMYNIELKEEAYAKLKRKQGLLVDFANFPCELVSLLEKCRQCTQTKGRFFVIIREDSSPTNDILGRHHIIFKIVEKNCLKVMLPLSPVDVPKECEDFFVKMKELKDSVSSGENIHRQSLNRINELSDKIEERDKEIEELRKQWSELQETCDESLANQISDIQAECSAILESNKHLDMHMDIWENGNKQMDKYILLQKNDECYQKINKKLKIARRELMMANVRIMHNENCSCKNEVSEATKRHDTHKDILAEHNIKLMKVFKLQNKKESILRELIQNCSQCINDSPTMQIQVIKNMHNENSSCTNELAQAKKPLKAHTAALVEQHKEKIHTLQETLDEKNKQLEMPQKSSSTTNEIIQELIEDLMKTKRLIQLH